ncbi:MAG: flagellar hook-associated family protein [Rhizobiaceae bacterium]|nr:flagellar hook-associated family protein [Rhizobiaceae bacterium]
MNATIRMQTMRTQSDLATAQIELATEKKANIGRHLGPMTSQLVSVENQIELIERIQVTTSFVSNRMSMMQTSMASLVNSGQDFVGQLTTEINGSMDSQLLATIANSALEQFTSVMNTSFKGEYVFSGINTDVASLNEYTAGSPAQTAVAAAFVTEFGFAPNSPLATGITPAALEAFVDGSFADLFDDTNWPALWSGSSERGMRSKISPMELAENPTTAQATSFRQVAASIILMKEFASANFNEATQGMLAEKSLETMSTGINGLASEQSKVGTIERRIDEANDRMDYQKIVLNDQVNAFQGIDLYEIANRLNHLSLSLEASYRATSKLQQLTLMSYI